MSALMLLAQAFAASQARAQVLVYELKILKESGINYHPFEGGFFVAPLLGGTGSFLLTSTDGVRTFTESGNSGRLFTAVDGKDKKAVISATTGGTGTAQGSLVALGKIEHSLKVNSPTISLTVRIAKSLTGTGVSADDESTASAPAADGSIGSAGMSQLRFDLDEAETNYANNHGLSLTQEVARLKDELGRRGFQPEAPAPTPTTGTTGTGTTGTTTTSETTSGP